ncbi:MAG: hypothetical protein GY786_07115 [Proteobacteria bacterium]|nr:hypothetical protein [Pseudomonadota bacterium]
MAASKAAPSIEDPKFFKQQVSKFVQVCKAKQNKLIQDKKRRHISMEALIKNAPMLSEGAVDLFFEESDKSLLAKKTVEEMRQAMHFMRISLNEMPNKKRFFILETMNFFSSQISIGKLIPALLMLTGNDQKKLIWEFSKPTFASINTNVEILVSTEQIFPRSSIHLDRGSLYLFVSDVAKILIGLFEPAYLDSFSEIRSPVELMLNIVKASDKDPQKVYQHILSDPYQLQKVVLDFVSTIQSHPALYDYSLKRHQYYKLFLYRLTGKDRFKGVNPSEISKILAGCFLTNQQRKPENTLIEAMISDDYCLTKETIETRNKFVDSLSPSIVYRVINQFMSHLQSLSKQNHRKELQAIEALSVKNILKNIWGNFIRIVEQGLSTVNENVMIVIKKIKTTFVILTASEGKQLKTVRPTPEAAKIVPKDSMCIARMINLFSIVETDIAAFRGAKEGANKKDYSYNSRLFKQDESTRLKMQKCFLRVFKILESNSKVLKINYKNQMKIKEYYVAYRFETYLICFGITHTKNADSTIIQEKELFPYVLLFKEADEKAFGRVLSRVVNDEDRVRTYNEFPLTTSNAAYYYEPLYHFLHQLDEMDWKSTDAQTSIRFLIMELNNIISNEEGLLYCKSLPKVNEQQ